LVERRETEAVVKYMCETEEGEWREERSSVTDVKQA